MLPLVPDSLPRGQLRALPQQGVRVVFDLALAVQATALLIAQGESMGFVQNRPSGMVEPRR